MKPKLTATVVAAQPQQQQRRPQLGRTGAGMTAREVLRQLSMFEEPLYHTPLRVMVHPVGHTLPTIAQLMQEPCGTLYIVPPADRFADEERFLVTRTVRTSGVSDPWLWHAVYITESERPVLTEQRYADDHRWYPPRSMRNDRLMLEWFRTLPPPVWPAERAR